MVRRANFVGNNYCCSATSASTILGALNNIPHRRRSVAADMGRDVETPLPPLTYATGHRTLLNAELAAKYLLGGGRFEHNGLEYDDTRLGGSIRKAAPASTGQSWLGGYIRETLGNAIPLSGPLASVMVPKVSKSCHQSASHTEHARITTALCRPEWRICPLELVQDSHRRPSLHCQPHLQHGPRL